MKVLFRRYCEWLRGKQNFLLKNFFWSFPLVLEMNITIEPLPMRPLPHSLHMLRLMLSWLFRPQQWLFSSESSICWVSRYGICLVISYQRILTLLYIEPDPWTGWSKQLEWAARQPVWRCHRRYPHPHCITTAYDIRSVLSASLAMEFNLSLIELWLLFFNSSNRLARLQQFWRMPF